MSIYSVQLYTLFEVKTMGSKHLRVGRKKRIISLQFEVVN